MNPRVIEDDNFQKLVKSIQNAPWMLQIRPIVVNKDLIVLGGNQRLKACMEAGFEEVWALNIESIDDSKQRELIILDNKDYGKWDKELLKNQFSHEELEKYDLLDVVDFSNPIDNSIEELYTVPDSKFENQDVEGKEFNESITDNLKLMVRFNIIIPNEESTSFENQLVELLLKFPTAKFERKI